MTLQKKGLKPLILDRVRAALEAVTREPDPKAVHFFRTSCRRLEAYGELRQGEASRKLRKLSKRLEEAQRFAGRVRDLDVQVALLREVQVEGGRDERRRLLADLQELRARAARKLRKELKEEAVAALRARLAKARRLERAEEAGETCELAGERALQAVSALPQAFAEVKAKDLHELRLACKRIRYTAEQALPSAEAQQLIERMKRVQDSIGRWHDWAVLRKRAGKTLPSESTLIRALRSHERSSRADALRQGREAVRPHIRAAELPALPPSAKRPKGATLGQPDVANAS